MENGCLGYPRTSTVTSKPPDSVTLPWLAIHSGTCRIELTVEMGRDLAAFDLYS